MRIGKFLLSVFIANLLSTFLLGSIVSGGSLEDNGGLEILGMAVFTVITILLMLPSLFFLYISEETNKIIGLLALHFLLFVLLYFMGFYKESFFLSFFIDNDNSRNFIKSDIVEVYLLLYLICFSFLYFYTKYIIVRINKLNYFHFTATIKLTAL